MLTPTAVGATLAVTLLWLRWVRMRLESRIPSTLPSTCCSCACSNTATCTPSRASGNPSGRFSCCGPDTAGQSMHDWHYAFTRRADEVVVEHAAELDESIADLGSGLDSHLRYPARPIQCTDSTWAAALERLLPFAHVIAMHLSGISSALRGTVYEIGRLVEEVPTEQVILFVFDTTDVEALEQAVRAAWQDISAVSPNRRAPGLLRIVNSQGFASRARADPEVRLAENTCAICASHGDRVRGLLCDAAVAGLETRAPSTPSAPTSSTASSVFHDCP